MSTYRRTIQTTRLDYHIPASDRWGASWSEVDKAVRAAYQEVLRGGRPPVDVADDAIRLWPADGEIIVSVELEREIVATEGAS
jgi:hypothetical protein